MGDETMENKPKVEISKKSSLITFVLALFFGAFGAHRFYTGKLKGAILMLLVTLFVLIIWFTPKFLDFKKNKSNTNSICNRIRIYNDFIAIISWYMDIGRYNNDIFRKV